MGELTDDMRTLLRAAYAEAPDGETFILEELHLHGVNGQARKDCAFHLDREPFRYLDRKTEFTKDAIGGAVAVANVRGTPYALSKLGRPVAKQIVKDFAKAKRDKWWKRIHWVTTLLTGIAVTVITAWLSGRIEEIHKEQQQHRETTRP